jgi:hypothetical protein
MYRLQGMIVVGLLATAAGSALAQETPQPRERERARAFVFDMTSPSQRGRLGISVDLRPNAATDSIGARVAGVTPGGAADRAGVHAGDIVVRLNGTRIVTGETTPEGEERDASRPGLRLVRLASRLDPGDTVRLEVRRDARPQTFTFAAEASDMDRELGRVMTVTRSPMPGEPGIMLRSFAFGAPLSDVELVKINPGLGEYFGTSEGLLVVSVGADSSLGLRAGDVILTIGGRRPTSPPHAMRILGTYDGDEQVQFDVMRQKHRITVSGRIPQRRPGEWRVEPNSFEFTMPRINVEPFMRLYERELPRVLDRELPPRMRMEMRMPNQMRIMQPKSLVRVDGIV